MTSPSAQRKTRTAAKPRWFQIAPMTLPRRISDAGQRVAVRLTQVSFSRSIVTLEADAPATASSQKPTYQPRSTCSAQRNSFAEGSAGREAAYARVDDDAAEPPLDLGHQGQRAA